jgi:CRISPR-associated protein Cas1
MVTTRELVIDKPGTYLGVRKGLFVVRGADGSRAEFSPTELSHISVRCRGVGISVDALKLACRFGIEITVYEKGRPLTKVVHAMKGGGVVTRQAQIEATRNEKGLSVARAMVAAKLHNQRAVLLQRAKLLRAKGSRLGNELQSLADNISKTIESLRQADNLDSVRAYEAIGANNYWSGVALMLPAELSFPGRRAWSPQDPFNKALNLGYGILRSRVWSAVMTANLDPYVGFLHLPRGRHMCLVSDLMEEFRPCVVDRPLIALAIEDTKALLEEARMERAVVTAVAQTLAKDEGLLERAILNQARKLASFLRGEIDAYEGFRIRW